MKNFLRDTKRIREEYRDKILEIVYLLSSFTIGFIMVRMDRYMEMRDPEKEFKVEEIEEVFKSINIEEEVELLSSIYIRGVLKGEE